MTDPRYPVLLTIATLGLLLAAPTTLAQPLVRLQGLDRLYFEHVGGKEDPSAVPTYLVEFLPPEVQAANFSPRKAGHEVLDGELERYLEIQDFQLPLPQAPSDLFLRQIIVGPGRITPLWWALYDHGRRSDVWYFTADPVRNDSKTLSNYEIVAVSATADGLKLQIYGSMFRPQGAWWITGKTFSFSMQDQTLQFSRLLNDFGFSRHFDLGLKPPDIDVSMEREMSEGFQTLNYDKVREPILRACELHDPLTNDDWEFNWTNMERTALCIAEKVKARRTSYRNFDQPSFMERGGKL